MFVAQFQAVLMAFHTLLKLSFQIGSIITVFTNEENVLKEVKRLTSLPQPLQYSQSSFDNNQF